MPRYARETCESRIYHIMLRGINRQDIFHYEEDHLRFLETVNRVKDNNKFALLAYCLMSNHVHLLLQEKTEEISKTIKRIGISYAWWYNWKYSRVGHLFQDRYRSEGIDSDIRLLSVVRYIHNNPVKAGMVIKAEDHKWSSCKVYYGKMEYPALLTDTSFILSMLDDDKDKAISKFKAYSKEECREKHLEYEVKIRKTDKEVLQEVIDIVGEQPILMLQTMEKAKRNELLTRMKRIEGTSQRQLSRITGINQSIISQA